MSMSMMLGESPLLYYELRKKKIINVVIYVSGKLSQVTVVVFQKVSVDRNVGPAANHPRKRAVRPATSPPISVIDLTVDGRMGNVNRSGVHFGS